HIFPSSIQREDETKMHEIPVIIRAPPRYLGHRHGGVGPTRLPDSVKVDRRMWKASKISSNRKTGEMNPELPTPFSNDNPKMNMTEFAEKKVRGQTTVPMQSRLLKKVQKMFAERSHFSPRDNRSGWEENMKFWTKDFWPPQSPDSTRWITVSGGNVESRTLPSPMMTMSRI
ncbi:Hypothetical protein FKW44_003933, partial [Caligus rogercresseyi]